MYASLGLINSRRHGSGEILGTHQKIDKVARQLLRLQQPQLAKSFPSTKEILFFEGARGPDGLKKKSPGKEEPAQFLNPAHDDGKLFKDLLNYRAQLITALKNQDRTKAAFAAAWLAHIITDGLTPAHHYPYQDAVDALMTDKDYAQFFGQKIKGIMRGNSIPQTLRNNWLYWGAGGIMTKHIAFEYGISCLIAPLSQKKLLFSAISSAAFVKAQTYQQKHPGRIMPKSCFYGGVKRIDALKMYERFIVSGWTTTLAIEVRSFLIPEIIAIVYLIWADCLSLALSTAKDNHYA